LRIEVVVAHVAAAARNIERDDHPVVGLDMSDVGARLLDDPHRFVSEDVPLRQEHTEQSVEMQIGATDGSGL
jgi:hypothetical protein